MAFSPLSTPSARGAAAIIGAVVGDAASTGTHWTYGKEAVEKAIGGPLGSGGEFIAPVQSYHKARRVGQTTMYGEGVLVLTRSLAATKNAFSEADFLTKWNAAFGLCGSFHGYADHTTRATLLSLMRTRAELEPATYPPKGTPQALRAPLYLGVKAAAEAGGTPAELAERAAAAAAKAGAPELGEWAAAAAAAWAAILHPQVASDDDQSNGLGRIVPAAVAAAGAPDFDQRVRRAIAVTQGHADVLGYAVPLARAIEAAVLGTASTPRAALEAALPQFDSERGAKVREALALADAGTDAWAALEKFGESCGIASTVPVTVFILARYGADGFEAAVRHNLPGDSASRACVIGGLLGALGGTPSAWVARLDAQTREEAVSLAEAVAAEL